MSGPRVELVQADDDGTRVDRWFLRKFPGLKHGHLQKLMRTGQVRVDGKRVKGSSRLETGQSVRIPPMDLEHTISDPQNIDYVSPSDREWIQSLILHADNEIIALNKPPGIAVQGGSGITRHIDGLLAGLVPVGAEKPKLVHRLDRDTSGVLLVALKTGVARRIGEIFRGREAIKTYWALVAGVPRDLHGCVQSNLIKQADSGGHEKIMSSDGPGKPAVTQYRVIDTAAKRAAWLALQPKSGRTHQLRVHCAELGTPIVGDRKYGGSRSIVRGLPNTQHLHLHARSITLPHPSGVDLKVVAPMSEVMESTWRALDFEEIETEDRL